MDTVAEGEFDRSQLLPEDGLKVEPSETPEDSKPPEPEIAILTSGKLLIIPESVYADFPGVKGFKVDREKGRIVLTPIRDAVVVPVIPGKALTIPEEVIAQYKDIDSFEVRIEGQRIILEPMRDGQFVRTAEELPAIDEIRRHIAAQGIAEQDVADAVKWARARRRRFRRCRPAGRPGLS